MAHFSQPFPEALLCGDRAERRRRLRRRVDRLLGSRARRVVCLLAGLWVINLFDLMLTTLAHMQGVLDEANPIARTLLPMGPQALACFKLVLVGASSAVLICYRCRLIAEVSAAVMLLVYIGVAVRWRVCYELYNLTATGAITSAEINEFESWISRIPLF